MNISTVNPDQSSAIPDIFGGRRWAKAMRDMALAWAIVLLLFWRDAYDMAAIWWNSSTFNHCLLIIPIIGWLVIQRKDQLVQLTPQPWLPPLLYIGIGALGWLLGDAAGVAVARQLALIMMLQGAVAALLGPGVTRGLLFPLFYMFFLLPFGEEAVPALQTLTAQMCMTLLGWAGIPAHIDGIFISTPAGLFKVAEACSGVKFLIAMIALGALVCNLCFASWWRRAVFMAACVAVPIIANGLRAFGTIYIAEQSGIEFASGFDHVFYGWIFFALVIAFVLAGAWRFFDKPADALAFDPLTVQRPVRWPLSSTTAWLGLSATVLTPILWSAAIASQPSTIPKQIVLPQVGGWRVVPYHPSYAWKPHFDGASHALLGRYRNAIGQEVDFYAALYDRQSEGRELIGYGQGAVDPQSKWAWTAAIDAPAGAKGERITAPGPTPRSVYSFYRVNGVTSGSAGVIKFATLKARLFGGNQQAVAILISAEHQNKANPHKAMNAFVKDLGTIDKVADHLAGLR